MPLTLHEQIDQIILARKEKGDALEKRKEALTAVKQLLRNSSAELTAMAKKIADEDLRKQYVSIVSSLDTREAQKQIDDLIHKMNEGIKRFSRDYISIATVGKERQGKSRFLQAISSLDNDIIPAYAATSCTGATSIIWCDSSVPQGSVRVTITFRHQEELLEIVKPYILELDPEFFKENTLSFNYIGYINLTSLAAKIEEGNAKQASALRHLTNIVDHFEEIQDLFGTPPLTLTDPELIKTYVAQNNGEAENAPNFEAYYKYLAVARADIYCPFIADTGKVRLVDTVGIGDTKYGIEDSMLNTVDKECDAAIVVTRPISGVQVSDQQLYTSLREKFKLRDTSQWLFYLVNHVKDQNDKTVEAFSSEVQKSKWAIAKSMVVDASDPVAVQNDFMLPMLQILVRNMDSIDRAYLDEVNAFEKEVQGKVRECLNKLPKLQLINANAMVGQEAYSKGKECYSRMTADLSNTVERWSAVRDQPNSELWNNVQKILNELDSLIPSAERIQAIKQNNGNLLGDDLWQMVLHNVRNEITDRFIEIDDVLEKETLAFKNSLVRSLYEELQTISPSDHPAPDAGEACDMVEWLKTMTDGVLEDDQYKQIRKAFNFLYRFEFNTRAQLIQEVRRQIYIIDPICAEYARPVFDFKSSNCGEAIHFYLTSRMSVIEDELRYHLSKLYKTPNMAFYAAAEEFYDRLTFSSDLSGNTLTSMSDVWGMFFQQFSSQLWENDSKRYEGANKLIECYNQMLQSLENYLDSTPA